MKTALQRALLANENCTCQNNGDYCETCQVILDRFERPGLAPRLADTMLIGRTYGYQKAIDVSRDLQSTYGPAGYTFHPTPDASNQFSRIQVYGPAGTFLGYY